MAGTLSDQRHQDTSVTIPGGCRYPASRREWFRSFVGHRELWLTVFVAVVFATGLVKISTDMLRKSISSDVNMILQKQVSDIRDAGKTPQPVTQKLEDAIDRVNQKIKGQ